MCDGAQEEGGEEERYTMLPGDDKFIFIIR